MSNWQVQCKNCGIYGHEYPMGKGDPMVRKDPQTDQYICYDCYFKKGKAND